MPDSERVERFLSSMVIDYEKWHDGVGYDLELLDQMTDTEKASVEAKIVARGVQDWRDLEALDRLKTPSALEVIRQTRNSPDEELRLRAHRYGSQPDKSELESAILAGLASYSAKSKAMDQAAEHPTPRIIAALLKCAKEDTGSDAYQAVATLYYIHGKIDSPHSWAHRKFFLRFVDPPNADRDAAFEELCRKLNVKT